MTELFYTALFIFLWSTGFIGARLGLPHAGPMTFLTIRFILVALLMAAVAVIAKAPWPRGRQVLHLIVTGLCMQAGYLGGVFVAISDGVPAGMTSLIVCLQPIVTAVIARFLLGEPVVKRQWLGLAIGLIGTLLVLSDRLRLAGGSVGLGWALVGLAGITLGTLYQKHYSAHFDWRTGSAVQFSAAAAAMGVGALIRGVRFEANGESLFALAWLVLVLSVGAMTLLNRLIRNGTAAKVTSLFYLVPPTTTLLAALLFGEKLSMVAGFGMVLAVWGVALARK